MIITEDKGALELLKVRFNNNWPTSKDLTLKLYVNDEVPADSDELAAYAEAAGGGYLAKTLTCGNWTIAIVNGIATATYALQVFTFTGPLSPNPTAYGYFVVDGNNVVQWSERFSEPCTPTSNGNHIDIPVIYQASFGIPA